MGGVLADEMGLGKTLMAIALLTSRDQDRPHLVVCPTSVVGNWERELARFAPDAPVIRHHGAERPMTRRAFKPGHVTVTSYALLRRDIGMLSDVPWDVVVFDEAQQIKNAASKGARAARSLTARARIAMTGTPIENRLSELWAIVDVTNPGLLGSQRAFNERFAVPVERWHDEHAAARLRRLVAPFVLRRRKDDPEVSVDLPPKQELTVTCSLTREQASLYQATIEQAFSGAGLGRTAFERRGRILALLTALKQICNHPAQYLRDAGREGTARLANRSGKLARATEILGEIVDNGERALVFTQFREMGELLARQLTAELDLPEVPFLHGGLPLPRRDAMVGRFQEDEDAPPILLVSLRAGGTGLNLTRASHVLHFDRWWNPAVEDQATDRVHRIGQTRAVTVHTMVTAGTIEERIATLLDRKRALADAVVEAGETWITELDDEELRDLVSLSTADVADADTDDDGPDARPMLTSIPGGRS
jgi:SNF2 family DNA or RNA helicase